jgi:hypothetical protein
VEKKELVALGRKLVVVQKFGLKDVVGGQNRLKYRHRAEDLLSFLIN